MPRKYTPKPEIEKTCVCGCERTFMTANSRRIFYSDYCQLKTMFKKRKEQALVNDVTNQFTKALRRSYSQLNFEQFCELIGEPTERSGHMNTYANDKWIAFRNMASEVNTLGTFLDKIVEFGLKDERTTAA